jgi:hypothetical protein
MRHIYGNMRIDLQVAPVLSAWLVLADDFPLPAQG